MDILKYDKENRQNDSEFIRVPIDVYKDVIDSLYELESFISKKAKEGFEGQRYMYHSDWLYTACELSRCNAYLYSYISDADRAKLKELDESN